MLAIALFAAITLVPCAALLAFSEWLDWHYIGRFTK